MNTIPSKPAWTWREGRRQRACELAQQGWTQQQIATALGVSQPAVSQWLHRLPTGGAPDWRAHLPPGRPPRLSAAQLAQLDALLRQGAEAFGSQGAVWTCRRVARLIAEQFGVRYHPAHVSRLLRRLGWTVQKPILRATQRDAQAITSWYHAR